MNKMHVCVALQRVAQSQPISQRFFSAAASSTDIPSALHFQSQKSKYRQQVAEIRKNYIQEVSSKAAAQKKAAEEAEAKLREEVALRRQERARRAEASRQRELEKQKTRREERDRLKSMLRERKAEWERGEASVRRRWLALLAGQTLIADMPSLDAAIDKCLQEGAARDVLRRKHILMNGDDIEIPEETGLRADILARLNTDLINDHHLIRSSSSSSASASVSQDLASSLKL